MQRLANEFLSSGLRHGPHRTKDPFQLNDLSLTLSISKDATDTGVANARPQTVLLSLIVTPDAASLIDCDAIYNMLVENLPSSSYASLEAVLDRTVNLLLDSHPEVFEASVIVSLRDPSPRFAVEATCRRDQAPSTRSYRFLISGLAFPVRMSPQEGTAEGSVVLDIAIQRQQSTSSFPFLTLSRSLPRTFSRPKHLALEALASAIAEHVLKYTGDADDRVTVRLSKPNVFPLLASAGVEVTRKHADLVGAVSSAALYPVSARREPMRGCSSLWSKFALGLSSGVGDRFANIEVALHLLGKPTSFLGDLSENACVSVINTSYMYDTTRIDVTDHPRFANCACLVETSLSPMQLLELAKAIETAIAGVTSEGALNFDILTYDNQLVDMVGRLVIPHRSLCECESMLRPLNDMIPDFVHPVRNKTIRTLLEEHVSSRNKDNTFMYRVIPFPKYPLDGAGLVDIHGVQVPQTAKHWVLLPTYPVKHNGSPKTYIMATLDVAPNPSSNSAQDDMVSRAIAYTAAAISSGADIIDIGGCPIHAGSALVSAEEELQRVIPIIEAIRTHPDDEIRSILISINTFRWEVAEKAVEAGANCIHDVYAFMGPTYPPEDIAPKHRTRMTRLARRLCVPVVLGHSRGEPGENMDYSAYSGDLVRAIQAELGHQVNVIVHDLNGVRRWNVFVDPGIRFSKSVGGQLALMRELGRVTAADEPGNLLADYPLLFEPPSEGTLGMTARGRELVAVAAVSRAVQQGASVVRMGNVADMEDVVTFASAIYDR